MPDNSKNNTTQEFNKLETENLAARLKQADLVNKIDFDKLILILDQEILLRIPNVQIAYLEQLTQQTRATKESGYGITFDNAGSWEFDNDFAINVIILGVDNGSSSHSDNRKNNFSVLGGSPTHGINRSSGSPEKGLILILLKQTQNFV